MGMAATVAGNPAIAQHVGAVGIGKSGFVVWQMNKPTTRKCADRQRVGWGPSSSGIWAGQDMSEFDQQSNAPRGLDDAMRLAMRATMAEEQSEFEKATQLAQSILDLPEPDQRKECTLQALNILSRIATRNRDYPAAERFLQRAVAIAERENDQDAQAIFLNTLGTLSFEHGDVSSAEKYFRRTLAIDEHLGRKAEIAGTLENLGNVAKEKG